MADPRMLFQPILYQAITPIHVGSGQDVGSVDLPVIRERTTDHPFLPGSGIRGALRSRCTHEDPDLTRRLFGNDDEGGEISAGCLSILDAHLLLFPVRSSPGLFRWITCPFVLERHRRLHQDLCGGETSPVPAPPKTAPREDHYLGGGGESPGRLYLEEYPFEAAPVGGGQPAEEGEPAEGMAEEPWTWNLTLEGVDASRVVLVSDLDFLHFVRTATLVRQRNRLTATKTVLTGHLFSVESLPAETWLLGFFGATEERAAPERKGGGGGGAQENAGESGQAGESGTAVDAAAKDDPRKPPAPMSKEVAAAKLRWLAGACKDENAAETHLTLGGDESVGLGIARLRWGLP